MYTTIAERTREIGILKSLGALRGYIVKLVLMEVLVLCVTGLLVGFLLTFLSQQILQLLFPAQPLAIPFDWVLLTVVFVSISGIIGGFTRRSRRRPAILSRRCPINERPEWPRPAEDPFPGTRPPAERPFPIGGRLRQNRSKGVDGPVA